MFKTMFITVTASFMATAVSAQQTNDADATSTSSSSSGIMTEGDTVNSVGVPSSNTTAPCMNGFSIGAPGLAGIGIPIENKDCVTRTEAKILVELSRMPAAQRRVAVAHFCRLDETMRDTMVSLGWCVVR